MASIDFGSYPYLRECHFQHRFATISYRSIQTRYRRALVSIYRGRSFWIPTNIVRKSLPLSPAVLAKTLDANLSAILTDRSTISVLRKRSNGD
jgi:hypothetical protein